MLLLWVVSLAAARGDEPNDRRRADATDSGQTADPPRPPLPLVLPDGRSIRTVGIYQGQLDSLVPDHFYPVSADRLLRRLAQFTADADRQQSSRLIQAVYWIDVRDDLMVSQRSEIDIESLVSDVGRLSLGSVNLAIQHPDHNQTVDDDTLPRMENDETGNLVAVFRGDPEPTSTLSFKWQLRGRAIRTGYQFDMQVPPTPQTRLVFSTSLDVELEALDGVLRSRSGPPPDAGTFNSGDKKRWYELDAGGLSQVRIRSRPTQDFKSAPLIVRDTAIQYRADWTGLDWTCRLLVEPPQTGKFPPLQFRNTTITGVNVNSYDVLFTTTGRNTRQRLGIEVPDSVLTSDRAKTTIVIRGQSVPKPNGWLELPMPIWTGRVESACTEVHAQLLTPPTMQIARWELPHDWRQLNSGTVADGLAVHAASGPPPAQPSGMPPTAEAGQQSQPTGWSRVRLSRYRTDRDASVDLRLEHLGGSLVANARIVGAADPSRLAPLRLQVEPDWTVERIVLSHSGRVIENPPVAPSSGTLMIWIDGEDTDENLFQLELKGTRAMGRRDGRVSVPATWFVKPRDFPSRLTASISPPSELIWSSDTAAKPDQIPLADLSESTADFLRASRSDTLLFQPQFGRLPALSLDVPATSYDAATVLGLLRNGSEQTEQIELQIEASGQAPREVSVQTGPAGGRPEFHWSMVGDSGGTLTSLPTSAVAIGSGADQGLYTIQLTDNTIRSQRLVGKRTYRSDGVQKITLPTVPGASAHTCHVWIGPGLTVRDKPAEVATALIDPAARLPLSMAALLKSGEEIKPNDVMVLRHDSSRQLSITVAPSDAESELAIVQHQRVRMLASSRGADRIEATYQLPASPIPLQITFDPSMQLTAMYRNGEAVELSSSDRHTVVVPAHREQETVRLQWNRDQYQNRWIRQCRIPGMAVSGLVLKADVELIPASDAFAPAALINGLHSDDQQYSSVVMQPGDTAILLRRNVVIALGWFVAILVFAVSWYVGQRNSVMLACGTTLIATVIILWWPWRIALASWLAVPMIAAGMLSAARLYQARCRDQELLARPDLSSDSVPASEAGNGDASTRIVLRVLPWLILLACFVAPAGIAQQPQPTRTAERQSGISPLDSSAGEADRATAAATTSEPSSTAAQPPTVPPHRSEVINVLVPLQPDGSQSGSTVYIDQSVMQELFPRAEPNEPTDISIQFAKYVVTIDQSAQDSLRPSGAVTVEAEYVICLENGQRNSNLVRIPIDAAACRRIKRLGKVNQIVPIEPESPRSVIATLPGGDRFHIRATLEPNATRSGTRHRIDLSIPKVSASQLVVESDDNLEITRVSEGQILSLPETELRRWTDQLGPTDHLVLDYQSINEKRARIPESLNRRYLIDAGQRSVAIDVELEPSGPITAGEAVTFLVNDERIPLVISDGWSVDDSERLGPSRRKLTATCNRDDAGPIRLLWIESTQIDRAAGSDKHAIQVPEIVATGSTKTAPAWFALRCDSAMRFAPADAADHEPLSIDQFNAAWQGNPVPVERAFVNVAGFPRPVIQARQSSVPSVDQQHHLHVSADRLELRYQALLTPQSEHQRTYLRFPRHVQLRQLDVAGRRYAADVIHAGNHAEVALGPFANADPVQIRLTGVISLDNDQTFVPPQLMVEGAVATRDQYFISRDPDVQLDHDGATLPPLLPVPFEMLDGWLERGWSPAACWDTTVAPSSDGAMELGVESQPVTFRLTSIPDSFDCETLVAIDQHDGQWTMETRVDLVSPLAVDIIDVDVPIQWCDSLNVQGALNWKLIETNDPARQILRMRYDRGTDKQRTLVIRGTHIAGDPGRVTIPPVHVLGLGKRQTLIQVPRHADDGSPYQWQTSAVEPTRLDPGSGVNETDPESQLTFAALSSSWSIELVNAPELDVDPFTELLDLQIFAQTSGPLVRCRWNLHPGSRESVDLRLPDGSVLLATWVGGRTVEPTPIDHVHADRDPTGSSAISAAASSIFRVPLAFSHIPQTIELLLRVAANTEQSGDYVPQLIGVPVRQRWITSYLPRRTPRPGSSSLMSLIDRRLAQASRPAGWMDRQLALAESALASIDFIQSSGQLPPSESRLAVKHWQHQYQIIRTATRSVEMSEAEQSRWETLDERLLRVDRHVDLAMPAEVSIDSPEAEARSQPVLQSGLESRFGTEQFSGFQIDRIVGPETTAPTPPIQSIASSDRQLTKLMMNGLSLFLVAGFLLCLLPAYRYVAPLVDHPALWLGLLGLFLLIIAPVAIGGSLMLIAVAGPVFPSKHRPLRSAG